MEYTNRFQLSSYEIHPAYIRRLIGHFGRQVRFLFDVGATVKEAQHLARHSAPNLTANIYARVRDERLHQVTE